MRYTINVRWNGSSELHVAVYNTFAEVLSYIQAVCDVNCETTGLRYNYEKGLI